MSKAAFDQYFAEVYGARWSTLRAALSGEVEKTVLRSPFALSDYHLDAASLIPARHLQVQAGELVADFCASPGGKTLAMIFNLEGEAEWFCSDLSSARVARLKAVLHDCLPAAVLAQVRVVCGDAARWGQRYPSTFDRVLVDAPCSGERHLLASSRELARWSVKGMKRLAVRQHALLCSALDSLKEGGRLVYSTCSISPLENDGVVAKLLKSRAGGFRVVNSPDEVSEATEHGQIILPDRARCGPIYFAVIEKI